MRPINKSNISKKRNANEKGVKKGSCPVRAGKIVNLILAGEFGGFDNNRKHLTDWLDPGGIKTCSGCGRGHNYCRSYIGETGLYYCTVKCYNGRQIEKS